MAHTWQERVYILFLVHHKNMSQLFKQACGSEDKFFVAVHFWGGSPGHDIEYVLCYSESEFVFNC